MTAKRTETKTGIIMIGHGEPEIFEKEAWTKVLAANAVCLCQSLCLHRP